MDSIIRRIKKSRPPKVGLLKRRKKDKRIRLSYRPTKEILNMLIAKGIIDLRTMNVRKGLNFNKLLNRAIYKYLTDLSDPQKLYEYTIRKELLDLQQERDKIEALIVISAERLRGLNKGDSSDVQ